MMEREAIEAAASAVASKSQYGGAATSVLGWLLSSEFTVVVGLLVAIGGFAVNWYYKAKANKRAEVLFKARMARIQAGLKSDTDMAALGEDGE